MYSSIQTYFLYIFFFYDCWWMKNIVEKDDKKNWTRKMMNWFVECGMRFCCTKLFNWRPEMFNIFFMHYKCGRALNNDKNLSVKMIYLKRMIWRNFWIWISLTNLLWISSLLFRGFFVTKTIQLLFNEDIFR